MEIECPPYAIACWLEGDQIAVRFPDRQLVHIPANETQRLINVMRHRAQPKAHLGVGTLAAPVQYDIDRVAEALTRADQDARKAAKAERERKALMRRVEKRLAKEAADELLTICGL